MPTTSRSTKNSTPRASGVESQGKHWKVLGPNARTIVSDGLLFRLSMEIGFPADADAVEVDVMRTRSIATLKQTAEVLVRDKSIQFYRIKKVQAGVYGRDFAYVQLFVF